MSGGIFAGDKKINEEWPGGPWLIYPPKASSGIS